MNLEPLVGGKSHIFVSMHLPTVWTLGSLLCQPTLSNTDRHQFVYRINNLCPHFLIPARETHSYAAEAAELRTVRAKTSISQFLHADEAAKHLSNALHRDRSKMTWRTFLHLILQRRLVHGCTPQTWTSSNYDDFTNLNKSSECFNIFQNSMCFCL